jgi:ABC-type uncharacterized transport system substrate-binding protein
LHSSTRRQKRIIKRIRATKPKIILAVGALAAQVTKEGSRNIPVVFCMVPNPHKYSLRGKNVAGT